MRLTASFLHARHGGTPCSPARAEATRAEPRGSPPHASLSRAALPLSPLARVFSRMVYNSRETLSPGFYTRADFCVIAALSPSVFIFCNLHLGPFLFCSAEFGPPGLFSSALLLSQFMLRSLEIFSSTAQRCI